MDVRLIRESEIDECNALHNAYYGKQRTAAQWRWEFARWRLPDGSIPYAVVRDGDRLVGTQALIPVRFVDGSGVFLTAKSEDTLIDPGYRGKNLFGQMYDVLFKVAREAGIQCIWGFTPARGAFTKAGFDFPCDTSQLILPLSSSWLSDNLKQQSSSGARPLLKRFGFAAAGAAALLASQARRLASLGRSTVTIEVADLDPVPAGIGELSHAFAKRWGAVTIFRDADYYRWRLRENPHAPSIVIGAYVHGRLVGMAAFVLDKSGIGFLVDIIVSAEGEAGDHGIDSEVASVLLNAAGTRLRRMGASCVRAWSVTDHPFDRLVRSVARSAGFFHLRRGHGVVRYTRDATDRAEPLKDMDQWYVTRLFTEGTDG